MTLRCYAYKDIDTWHKVALGEAEGHIYSRNTNPTVRAFEDKVKELEGAEAATSFSSGMAAISNTLATFLKPGDRLVSIKDSYGGTNVIFNEFLPPLNIDVSLCETGNYEQIESEIAKGCKVLYLETPTNPTIKITDIKRLSAAAKKVGALVVVDNTFATPINQRPLELGADITMHSCSKYLGGTQMFIGGSIALNKNDAIAEEIQYLQNAIGAVPSPFDCYLLIRSIKTLSVRMEKHNSNAMQIASFLNSHPKITKVYYPGLEDSKNHDIAKKQMHGFGGMMSIVLDTDMEGVKKFLKHLSIFTLAESLGGVESLIEHPAIMTHASIDKSIRDSLGISDSLLRLSIGIEDVTDIKMI